MKRIYQIPAVLMMFLVSVITVDAQEISDTLRYRVSTVHGNEFIGFILSDTEELLELQTDWYGKVSIPRQYITKVETVEPDRLIEGKYWGENPQSTRYFWTPNGYGLKKGEGYYQNIWVLYNQVSYGFTNTFSLSAGMIPLFLFSAGLTPVWVIPKFSIPVVKDKFNLSAGALLGGVIIDSEDSEGVGIVFGTATFGNRNSNVNFGMGWGYAAGEMADRPIFNLSFMHRTGANAYLISENYFFYSPDFNLTLLSFGGRWMIKNVGLDFALYLPLSTEMDSFIAFPFLGVTIPFGD